MKKAILIICVLSVLALLVVPVMAGVLSAESDLDRQIGPKPRPTGRNNQQCQAQGRQSPTLIAWVGARSPKAQG